MRIAVNLGAARKVFNSSLVAKTILHPYLPLFPIVLRLGYRINWLLGLGELLRDPPCNSFGSYARCTRFVR